MSCLIHVDGKVPVENASRFFLIRNIPKSTLIKIFIVDDLFFRMLGLLTIHEAKPLWLYMIPDGSSKRRGKPDGVGS